MEVNRRGMLDAAVRVDGWLGCGEQLLHRHTAGLLAQERLVAGVLEQPAHEVGHARDEVANGAVRTHPEAAGCEGVLELVAQTPQNLELDL
jgi:hypothetical protein